MKKLQFSGLFLVMIIALAGAFAFTPKPAHSVKTGTIYYYVGSNTLADMQKPENWLDEGTECEESGDYPCSINYTAGDRASFDTHVENFPSIAQAALEANSTRN